MKVKTQLFGLLTSTFLSISPAFGWGDLGHQTVAQIAEKNLTQTARLAIEKILGPEPLAVAGVWPDIVRSDKARFDAFAPYHFLEVYPGYASYDEQPSFIGVNRVRAIRDGSTALRVFPKVFVDERMDRTARMIALRYYIHVVGDVHQPLHVGNGIDLGANLCQVRWMLTGEREEHALTDLHSVWDEKIIDYLKVKLRPTGAGKRFFGYAEFADRILSRAKAEGRVFDASPGADQFDYRTWYSEAVTLRKTKVYPDPAGSIYTPFNRPYCEVRRDLIARAKSRTEADIEFLKAIGADDLDQLAAHVIDPNRIPTLTEADADTALLLIEDQIYKAGMRLAARLNAFFEQPGIWHSRTMLFEGFELRNLLFQNYEE